MKQESNTNTSSASDRAAILSSIVVEQKLTVQQIAERWQIKDKTVREYIASGQLYAYKFGRVWRVNVEDVEAFENKRFKRRKPFQKLK